MNNNTRENGYITFPAGSFFYHAGTESKLNNPTYWWCFFDLKTEKLYDQYCHLIMENATDFLVKEGHIDKDKNILKEFI